MKVPVRRQPETQVSERQQGYARPVAPLDVSPVTNLVEGLRDQLLDEQDARQRIELNRRLLQETNELQSDFEERRRNPEVSPIDFADTTDTAYTERHTALLGELRGEGYSQDLLDDFDGRLGTIRQGFFVRGLDHQLTQLRARDGEEIEEVGVQTSQYVAADPMNNYVTGREMLRDSIRLMPNLTESERADKEDEQLAILRDGAGRALAIQNPQFVIDTLDPQGLTAPFRAAAPATPGATPTASGWQGVATTVASELGLDPVEVAAVMSYETGGSFSPTVMGGTGGNHMGLIQFGREERQQYGITANSTPEEWSTAILSFMRDRGFRRGMSLLDFYSTINAGRPGLYERSDSPGNTVRTHLERLLREHRDNAERWLGTATPAVAPAPTQTASVQPVDLPPSQARQQSDSLIETITDAPGLRVPGNIDLASRPAVSNADGTVSTVRSISIGTDRGEVLIPTVIEGRVVSEAEATEHYRATGEHLGIFDTAANATAYAQQLHQEQARAAGVPASADISSIRTGNALLDDLNGRERLQLLGLAREQLNRVTATQRAEMDVRIGNIVAERMSGEAGTPLPTEQDVLRIYGPIEGPQRMAQMRAAEEARPAIIAFRTQSAANIQTALEALEPTPGSPTYATELPIYEAAQRAAQALLTERERDPAAYAMRYFPAVGEAAQQGTAQYYAALDRVYETLGIDPSDAPVMPAQAVERLNRQYRDMTPTQRREFMRTNMAQMGEDRFRRFVRDMEGTTAEGDARVFELLRTYPGRDGQWGTVYEHILEGREIIATDPARKPRSEQMLGQFRQLAQGAIGHLDANTSRTIQEAAEGLYAFRNGNPELIEPTLYRQVLAEVLGGNLPADMNGDGVRETILPPRTNQQQFEAWVESQTLESISAISVERRPPRYGDLRTAVPMSDIIDHGSFVMIRPGRYMIMMPDGRPLMVSTGRPFRVNIDPREVVRATPQRRLHGVIM